MAAAAFDPNMVPVSDAAHHAAKVFLGVTVPLFTFAFSTLIARISFKLRSHVRLGLDDYLILIGFVLATVDWALYTAAIAWGSSSSVAFTTMDTIHRTIKLGVIAIPIWGFSLGFIKLSVAFLLLRFQTSPPWRLALYVLMALIILATIGSCLVAILQCFPLSATWDPTHHVGAKCIGTHSIRVVSNFVGGFSIATDLCLSLFPLTFILSLRRPRVEKVLIACLMAVGLTASAASITKAVYVQKWVDHPDGMLVGFMISTLGMAEMFIGLIAACLPCLKSTIQGALIKCGVDFESGGEDPPSFWGSRSIGHVEPKQAQQGGELELGQGWQRGDVKPSSSKSSDKLSRSAADREKGAV